MWRDLLEIEGRGFTQLKLSAPEAGRALTLRFSPVPGVLDPGCPALPSRSRNCRLVSGTAKERASRDPLPRVCLWWFRLSGFPGSARRRIRMP